MAQITGFVMRFVTATVETVKHYITLSLLTLNLLLQNAQTVSKSWSSHARDWYAIQKYLHFDSYSALAAASAHHVIRHYQNARTALRRILEVCLARAKGSSAWVSIKIKAITCGTETMFTNSMEWTMHKLRCIWLSMPAYFNSFKGQVVQKFRDLRSLGSAYIKLATVLATKVRTVGCFVRDFTVSRLLAAFESTRYIIFLCKQGSIQLVATISHLREAVNPHYLTAFLLVCIAAILIQFRHRVYMLCLRYYEIPCRVVGVIRQVRNPMSQLQSMQLEMVFRKTLPGSYCYEDELEHWPRQHYFGSTLQLLRRRKPYSLFSFPPAVRSRIFAHALASNSRFSWLPLQRSLRLDNPNMDFHRIWSVAHSLGFVLPGNTITVDACGVVNLSSAPSSLPRPATWFVQPRPSGREQLLDMLARLALPTVERKLWMERVAASMRAGEAWVLVVREAWHRVWSFDVGLMVGALSEDDVAKAFPGISVEYRIVVGNGDMAEDKQVEKMLEFVRQLRESVALGDRHEKFGVVIEGLEAWEGVMGTEELTGKRVVEVVRQVVAEMNDV